MDGYRPITIRKETPIQINLSEYKPCPPRLRKSCGSVDGCRFITSHTIHSPCGLFHGRLSLHYKPCPLAYAEAAARWTAVASLQAMPFIALAGYFMDGCRSIASHAPSPTQKLRLGGRLSPYKMSKINALTSKLAERYFFHFAWLVT